MNITAYDDDVVARLSRELSGDDAQVRAVNMVRTQDYGKRIPIVSNGRDGAMIWLSRAGKCWLITDADPRLSWKHE